MNIYYPFSLKNEIPKHFIKVKRNKKNKDLKKVKENRYYEEISLLNNIIELDKSHKLRQEKCNENCRYNLTLPYKDNKVTLNSSPNFINASWIHMPHPYYFIATQGPLPHTIEDFWIMCYENKIPVIVMLCNLIEDNKEKCADYWNIKDLKKFEITIIKEEKEEEIYIRTFQIFNKELKDSMTITQIHFTSWEDHNSLSEQYFNTLIKIINKLDDLKKEKKAVIHCSAGVGRTGTFICFYNLYHEIMKQINVEKNSKEIIFCIFNLVRKIKEMRMYSVENVIQYSLLYQFSNYLLLNYNVKNKK